jgi:FAR1 DNA-binding domain
MTTLPPFQLDIAPPISEVSTRAGPSLTVLCLADDPATSRRLGSFNHDRETGLYPHEWGSLAEFDAWRQEEEIVYSIEFVVSRVAHGNKLWTSRRHYACSRGWSGGRYKYEKKHPDQLRKKGSKKTGCQCKIVIKQYPHTQIILGRYEQDHNHQLGLANVTYTRTSHASQEQIRTMLEKKVDPREIVRDQP